MRAMQERAKPFQLIGHTAGAMFVVILYVVIPALITVGAVYPGSWKELWLTLAMLIFGEIVVFTILVRTTRKQISEWNLPERRVSTRRKAAFDVNLLPSYDGGNILGEPVPGKATDASPGGLAVLVDKDQWRVACREVVIRAHLGSDTVVAKAHLVSTSDFPSDSRPKCLIRLRVSEMEASDEQRYTTELDRLPAVRDIGQQDGQPASGRGAGQRRFRGLSSRLFTVPGVLAAPLAMILLVQSVVSTMLRNSAYQDEALYLYAGRQVFEYLLGRQGSLEYNSASLSGLLYLYPLLGGILDWMGGLELARLLSLGWMLCATGIVYMLSKRLYSRESAWIAAALFAIQAPVLFLGRLATFDAMSLALVAGAALMALYASQRRRLLLVLAVAVLLLLAAATKYAALLFVPSVLALLAWHSLQIGGRRQALLYTAAAVGMLASFGALLLVIDPNIITSFIRSTAYRTVMFPEARLHLARRMLALGGPLFALGLVGIMFSPGRQRLLSVVLLSSALLAPLYHIYLQEFVALHKHIAYGFIFLAPLAGHAVTRLGARRKLVGLAICLVLLTMGIEGSLSLIREWPNSGSLISALRPLTLPRDARVLAEPAYETRYYLQDGPDRQWTDLWRFRYVDKTGRYLRNEAAYQQAIEDGYFDLVVLSFGPNKETAEVAHEIEGGLSNNPRYKLVDKEPYYSEFGSGYYWIWQKLAVTDVQQ